MYWQTYKSISACIVFLSFVGAAAGDRTTDALQESQAKCKPLLAIISRQDCQPCQRLAQQLKDEQLGEILQECVLLKLDANSRECVAFQQQYSKISNMVPAVYVILPDGNPMYAECGYLDSVTIDHLMREAVAISASIRATEKQRRYRRSLESAKQLARQGKLIQAFRKSRSLAQRQGSSPALVEARSYHQRVDEAVRQWIQDLDEQMSHGGRPAYGAAYRLTQIYVELGEDHEIQNQAGQIIRHYGQQPGTRLILAQARYLLRAKYREEEGLSQDAALDYRRVIKIDRDSIAAVCAAKRLKRLNLVHQDNSATHASVPRRESTVTASTHL